MCLCLCIPVFSLLCWQKCVVHACSAEPADEEAFQSDHRTQMLRLAWGNHTQRDWHLRGYHHHWAQSKLFSTPMRPTITGKMLYKSCPMVELCLAVLFVECEWMSPWCYAMMGLWDVEIEMQKLWIFQLTVFFQTSDASDCKWWAVHLQVPTYLRRSNSSRKVLFKSNTEFRTN